MYLQNRVFQSVKTAVIAIICVSAGCSKQEPQAIKLDSALETHHALILDGKSGSARVRLRQFMETNGETSDPLFLMGFSYHQEQKYSKAVEWLQKSVVAKGRLYSPALHFLGWSHLYLGDARASKKAFTAFLLLNPDEPDSLFALGLLAMESGELKTAAELFASVVRLVPRDIAMRAKATARWGDVLAEQSDWLAAVTKYEQALKMNPDLYEAWYRLAQALKRIDKEEGSAEAMQNFLASRHRVHPEWEATRFPE